MNKNKRVIEILNFFQKYHTFLRYGHLYFWTQTNITEFFSSIFLEKNIPQYNNNF